MKKKNLQLLLVAASLLIFASVNSVFAQSAVNHRYQVSLSNNTANSSAIVETSVDKELVSVSIQRKNQPTHYYNSYVQIGVSAARIGRKPLFTIYHDDQRVQAGQFDKKFFEVKGTVRSQKKEIVAIHEELEEDMRMLRAVRAYDKDADVLLAELSYPIVTYDGKFLDMSDAAALEKISVVELGQTLAGVKKSAADLKAEKVEFVRVYKVAARSRQVGDDLDSCIQDAYNRYNECSNDSRISDKSICYNNRSNEVRTCYSTYGGKKPPIQP